MDSKTTPTINTYVSDMLALEKHTIQPLEHQAKDEAVKNFPDASRAILTAHAGTESRINILSAHLESIGGHAGEAIKSGVSGALGAAAAAISNVRKTEVSKYVRDDYSAFALTSAGYTMLHTTALALGDAKTAQIAQNALEDVASSVMQFSAVLPATVLMELREEGVAVDASVISKAEEDVKKAWSQSPAANN